MNNLKENIANNLVALRKNKKLTQSELAEKISYSDKTISKWEKGDAIPDVETLVMLAEYFEVSVDDILYKTSDNLVGKTNKENKQNKTNKIIITLLSALLVWLTATIFYVQAKILYGIDLWIAFIWAVPISSIVVLVFNSIWGKKYFNFIIISFFVWTLLASIHLQFINLNMWPVYFLGIPLQVAVILWSQLKSTKN